MPSEKSMKALKMGLISQKQYDKLPPALLEAIVNSKMKNSKSSVKKKKVKSSKK